MHGTRRELVCPHSTVGKKSSLPNIPVFLFLTLLASHTENDDSLLVAVVARHENKHSPRKHKIGKIGVWTLEKKIAELNRNKIV